VTVGDTKESTRRRIEEPVSNGLIKHSSAGRADDNRKVVHAALVVRKVGTKKRTDHAVAQSTEGKKKATRAARGGQVLPCKKTKLWGDDSDILQANRHIQKGWTKRKKPSCRAIKEKMASGQCSYPAPTEKKTQWLNQMAEGKNGTSG